MYQYVELREYRVQNYLFNVTEEQILGKIAVFFFLQAFT